MGDRLRRHAWVWKDGDNLDVRIPRFKVEHLDELPSLRDRLDELEKRMKELEKKLAR
jgi:predicted phage-related endonuclease